MSASNQRLLAAGFSSVRRYQLGIPVWRALVGLTEMEKTKPIGAVLTVNAGLRSRRSRPATSPCLRLSSVRVCAS